MSYHCAGSYLLVWDQMSNPGRNGFIFTGVDIAKAMLGVYCPTKSIVAKGESSEVGITSLCSQYRRRKPPVVFVMEATGGYEHLLLEHLAAIQIPGVVVNPKRVRDFAKGIGLDAKTDPIDAFVISRYREDLRYRCFVMARSESQRLPQDIRQILLKLRVGMKRMSQRTPLVHSEISSTNLVSISTIFSKPKPESKVRHLHRS